MSNPTTPPNQPTSQASSEPIYQAHADVLQDVQDELGDIQAQIATLLHTKAQLEQLQKPSQKPFVSLYDALFADMPPEIYEQLALMADEDVED